jgi:2',3'-cyclic-nucleotide 2'-phosphodiesterase (5'-nucleotidase family)
LPLLCVLLLGANITKAQEVSTTTKKTESAKKTESTATQSAEATPKPIQNNASAPAGKAATPLDLNVHATENAIDASIPNDPAVDAVLAPYSSKVRELDVVIGTLEGGLQKRGIGAGSLGNFVVDAIRAQAVVKLGKPVLLAITNSGGLRKNQIAAGEVRASDIYELLPFENALVAVDLSGEQLLRYLNVIVAARDAQSGARIKYRNNAETKKNEIVTVKLGGGDSPEATIDPAKTYTIVTIDYLVKRGGDYAVLQESKNIQPLGLTMRDAVLMYVKAETAAGRTLKARLDGRWSYDRSSATKPEEEQP